MKSSSLAAGLSAVLAAVLAAAPAVAAPAPPPAAFARCAACHNAAKDAPAKIGPNLWGVYGARAARTRYNYSPALKGAGLQWNDAALDKWLTAPMTMVPGTMMSFPGIKDPAKRAELIAWLKTLR